MIDPALQAGGSFDWIGPVLHVVLEIARGHKLLYGSMDEMEQLRGAGITCHSPQWIVSGQEWVWQVKNRDFKRARKILGC